MNIAVLGGGSWGTAIARLLSNKGINVSFYIRNEKTVNDINLHHENIQYLEGVSLNNLRATNNIEKAVKDADIIVLAIPTGAIRSVLNSIKEFVNDKQIFVN